MYNVSALVAQQVLIAIQHVHGGNALCLESKFNRRGSGMKIKVKILIEHETLARYEFLKAIYPIPWRRGILEDAERFLYSKGFLARNFFDISSSAYRCASIGWERQLEPGNLAKQINFSLFESRNKTVSSLATTRAQRSKSFR